MSNSALDPHQHHHHDHDRRFQGEADRLRAPQRLALMEVPRVAALSIENLSIKNMLDVGTGTGVFAEAFSELGLAVTGIDVNADLLSLAQQHVSIGKFQLAPAEKIPFPDRSFDLAFLGHVLHETDDALTALTEARRVSRQRVAILEWPYRDEQQGPPLQHRLKPETIADLIKRAGYTNFEYLQLQHMDFYRLTP